VQLVAATAKDIKATLQTYLPDDKVFVIDDIIDEVRPEDFTLPETKKIEDIADLEQAAGDSPVVKLVNYASTTPSRIRRATSTSSRVRTCSACATASTAGSWKSCARRTRWARR
jgi:hypothetical protein